MKLKEAIIKVDAITYVLELPSEEEVEVHDEQES